MKKYWYIWFSIFAFMALSMNTLYRVQFGDVDLSRPYPSAIIVYGNFFLLGILVICIPSLIVTAIAFGLAEAPDSLLAGAAAMLCFYLTGVYATYRHALWREKHNVSRTRRA